MGQEEPKGRRAFRKILEDRNEKMRRLLMKMEAEDAKREAKDAAREQRAIREAVEEAKTFREYLEAEGISYTTLLHLIALQEDMSSLAHNILLGYEHGEGWPRGPDEKNTGPLAVYMDGQPVGIAYGEIQEISLVAEEPAEAMPPAVISGGSMTITLEQASEAVKSLTGAWDAVCTAIERAGKALARVWQAARVALEFQEAMRWASVYNRPLAYRYRHTKKKRTRKKYAKRILTWYREEVL